jgi:hypothetical protein
MFSGLALLTTKDCQRTALVDKPAGLHVAASGISASCHFNYRQELIG